MPPELPDRRIGLVLQSRYKILSRIAEGGMGAVYRGERLRLGKPVAVKFLHAHYATNRDFVRRFEIEARAMSRISHPHCCLVLDFGMEDGMPYLVMDYVTGMTLRQLLEDGSLVPPRAIDIIIQVLAGLAHAHSVGVVHRDVKPENIVLAASEEFGDHVRILDFGFAKLRDDSSLTQGLAVGTPSYMSPEQSTGGRIDVRTDVYQVGVVLFELLTGQKPFQGEMLDVIRDHQHKPPPKLSDVGPVTFTKRLEDAVARALAKNPDERFQSAAEFANALTRTAEGRPPPPDVSSPQPMPLPPPEPPPPAPPPAAAPRVLQANVVPVAREPIPAAPPPPRTERKRGTPAFVGFLLSLLAIGGIVALVMHDQGQPALVPPAASPTLVAPDPPHAPTDPTPAAPDPAAPPAAPEGPAGSTVPPEDIQGIEDVLNAIETGRRDEAMRLLQIHRQLRPRSAYLAYLHGNVFFDRMWWTQGFAAYEVAIKHNPAYKSDPVLIRNVLRSLWSAKAYRRGQTFLLKLGKPALPAVRAMADAVKSPHVKARATAMAKRLEAL